MNADDRATPRTEGLYRPPANRNPAQPQGIRPTASAPQQTTTGQVPQRAPFRSGQFPTTTPATSGQTPTAPASSGARPSSAAPGTAFTPTTPRTTAPTTGAPSSGAQPTKPASSSSSDEGIFGSVKGFALRAKDSLTEGDDLKTASTKGGPRKVRVLVSRLDPFSALKIGFLLSIAAGIMLTVAVYVLWNALNTFGLFSLANEWVAKLFTTDQELNILQFFDLNKVMSATVLVAVVNVILLSALATIGAFLYNTVSSVVGGIYLTLTDD